MLTVAIVSVVTALLENNPQREKPGWERSLDSLRNQALAFIENWPIWVNECYGDFTTTIICRQCQLHIFH